MCELFGFSARENEDVKEQLKVFYSHSLTNPHGWGLMYDKGIVKGCERASDSKLLKTILDDLQPQKLILGHVRFATVGSITQENCHPFSAEDVTGRRWTLIHNGTIYSGKKLIPYLRVQTGDTDSERLFLCLLNSVNKAQTEHKMSADERCRLIDGFVSELSPRNKLNLMIYDGELLYIHKNMKETMKYRKFHSGYIFSTTELDDDAWEDVPIAQLFAYKNGELFYSGEPHNGIFVPNLQYIKAMDAMNI